MGRDDAAARVWLEEAMQATISTVPIRQWYLWGSFVDGASWLFQKAYNAHQWVVYTPPPA